MGNTPPPFDSSPSVIESFGSYRLIGLLSQGGMAELYLALRSGIEGFEKVVALKRILPHLTEDPSFIEMFLNEARLAAKLDHPNIVRIYDLGEIHQQYFMAMEYLPGEDLRQVIHRARAIGHAIPIDAVTSIIQEAAAALHFAHGLTAPDGDPLGLVHRDVSPSNIIVTYHGSVKLVDFGIAKARNSSVQTQAGGFKGKLHYAAPEQLLGGGVDARTDVFGLGLVMWELLTGQRLFRGDSNAAIVNAIRSAPIPAPSTLRPEIPKELDQITLKCLAREPKHRYSSADEVLDALFVLDLRGHRNSRSLGQWLEKLFGEDRARAKIAIAQGKDLERPAVTGILRNVRPPTTKPSASANLASSPLAEALPGDSIRPASQGNMMAGSMLSHSMLEATSVGSNDPLDDRAGDTQADPGRNLMRFAFAGFIVLSLAGIGGALWIGERGGLERDHTPATAALYASLEIDSEPRGAAVFINGEPTGAVTPTTLRGLIPSQPLHLRLEKAGFSAGRDTVQLSGGDTARKRFELEATSGIVHLEHIPKGSKVFINGRQAPAGASIELQPGSHEVRLETEEGNIETRTIVVQLGEQSLRFDRPGWLSVKP